MGKKPCDQNESADKEIRNNKGGQRSGRPNSRPKGNRKPKSEKQEEGRSAKNDIGWYSRYPAIYDAAANLVWSRPTGVPAARKFKALDPTLTSKSVFFALAGIMAHRVVHGIGSTVHTGTNAPVNVASKAIYTWTRHMNSGHSNYDNPDLMLYLLAMNEAYAAISFIGRIAGTVAMFSGGNRLLPDQLLAMQGVDGQSIRDNYANFRARINILIQKTSSLVVPLGMDIFNRTSFLYANYYTEGESVKDQIHFMYPRGFRVFDRDSSGAGYLKWYDLTNWYSGGKLTWGSLCQLLEDILAPLIADEDINIMAGDILKAYGENIQRLVFLPEMFIATPQKVEEVLWQLKNEKIVMGTVSNLDITQDSNHEYLIYDPNTTATQDDILGNTCDVVLVTDKVPTKEINMINSRLAITADYGVAGGTPTAGSIICGSDFVDRVDVCEINNSTTPTTLQVPRVLDFGTITPVDVVRLCMFSQFKYAPEITMISASGATIANENYYDVDDFAIVDPDTLETMHDAAILSLFAVPHIGM